jgi:3',5'-cyclic AMP phosphodiesterase CpdA
VVWLALSGRFGRVRLWKDRAEFEQAGQGVCGLRKMDRRSGLAHLDLLFSDQTSTATRDLFTVFVEEHLQKEGVTIKEVLEMVCGTCGYRFDKALVRDRIQDGHADVLCPRCETRLPISAGAKKARESNPALGAELIALKQVIDQRKLEDISDIKRAVTPAARPVAGTPVQPEPIRILHLSDLHLGPGDDPMARLQPLLRDLRDKDGGLGFDRVDYLVVSGDLTNKASSEEFEQVYAFLSVLIDRLKITAARCIIVPGNHDLSWEHEVYDWRPKRKVDVRALKAGNYVAQGDGFLVRDEARYHTRFANFGKFYHELRQEPYPLDAGLQCLPFLFEETRLQFLIMNSAWEIDEYYPERSSINANALAAGLLKAAEQIETARADGRLAQDAHVLRLAVWHHPVTGNEKIAQDAFLEQLRQEDFKLCLHGHIHEDRADIIGYLHPTRHLYIAGAGSFGAPVNARPESTPRLYNVLEVWPDHSKVRVHTRCLRRDGGAWEGWAVWPDTTNARARLTYYDIALTGSGVPA